MNTAYCFSRALHFFSSNITLHIWGNPKTRHILRAFSLEAVWWNRQNFHTWVQMLAPYILAMRAWASDFISQNQFPQVYSGGEHGSFKGLLWGLGNNMCLFIFFLFPFLYLFPFSPSPSCTMYKNHRNKVAIHAGGWGSWGSTEREVEGQTFKRAVWRGESEPTGCGKGVQAWGSLAQPGMWQQRLNRKRRAYTWKRSLPWGFNAKARWQGCPCRGMSWH